MLMGVFDMIVMSESCATEKHDALRYGYAGGTQCLKKHLKTAIYLRGNSTTVEPVTYFGQPYLYV